MNRQEQLTKLRHWMSENKLAAYVLPMADEFLSEYVPPHAKRLTWLTGFDGSNGTAVITADKAVLFTDGRYIIQAHQQLDTSIYDVINMAQTTVFDWLSEQLGDQAIGIDGMLHSQAWLEKAEKAGLLMQMVNSNPIDGWQQERLAPPLHAAWLYPPQYAGQESKAKRDTIGAELAKAKVDALFISAAENINWLLNIRGGDLEGTPVVNAYALLYPDGKVDLFAEPRKFSDDLKAKLDQVQIEALDVLPSAFAALKNKSLLVDKSATPAALVRLMEQAGVRIEAADDPIVSAKAVKNHAELKYMREAHVKDGAALVKSIAQMDTWVKADEEVDELKIDALLNQNREAVEGFISLSFPAIVGAGEHGAIVHYRVTEQSNRQLAKGELLLIDSGGQYMGGTTDVTRTLAIGHPSAEQKKHYTLVLKGHLALGNATFPEGTPGSQLDALARQYLWAEGLDYDHGTGHGVGACLGVHEGPQGISKRANTVALKLGMILSNEPGYYAEGKYGIRIENLVEVVQKQDGFLGFNNLTMVPYARDLMDVALLDAIEINTINAYHQQVLATLTPHLGEGERAWLKNACAPVTNV